ncbi:hypothetical protein DICPUDRAFT_154069 [Dictyostelium purpureum]|uniref:DUF4326 domain-containing protein n=1 Tax=Dictyostelium purpureum TaxID=5786 RepID=F0ZQH9_DICPU|nr:uncharacterized protein DICPUDRAFT_154069 [Dictyostelium purpureum]EGC33804.1 hypothetical protein DICPUDRAFT_154069 [Dictyostelium purpureum]|eukprot:XP_003289675.1 hypothetical protein DICPUDRAFT_154069 [Dictyostelium purpureum]
MNHQFGKEPKEDYDPVTSDGVFLYDKKYSHLTVHCKVKPYDVYIGRKNPTIKKSVPEDFKWGNPFTIGKHGDRNQVIKRYRDWIFAPEQDGLFQLAKTELKGKTLACWCAPLNCHGFVLNEIANSPIQNKIDNNNNNNIDENEKQQDNNNNNINNNEIDLKLAPLTMANIINKNNNHSQKFSKKSSSVSFPPLSSPSTLNNNNKETSPTLSSSPSSKPPNKISFADMISQQQQDTNINNKNNININNNNYKTSSSLSAAPSLESENDFPSLSSKKKKL